MFEHFFQQTAKKFEKMKKSIKSNNNPKLSQSKRLSHSLPSANDSVHGERQFRKMLSAVTTVPVNGILNTKLIGDASRRISLQGVQLNEVASGRDLAPFW
ncbi:hypothetical protein CDAR_599151 [Caerostris darwini]|uniref:Uncharacterized protein n=1 Tax=Caerostris darwini TaxID=1538125 RepID=A0AAV4R5D4_9ARAC|nr:hypothetical protein CDAR_599151 [Caerostris darwini]